MLFFLRSINLSTWELEIKINVKIKINIILSSLENWHLCANIIYNYSIWIYRKFGIMSFIYSYKFSPQDVRPYNFYSWRYLTLNLNLYQCPLYIITYHLVKLLSLKTTSLTIFIPPYLRQGNIIAHNAFLMIFTAIYTDSI